MASTDDYNLPGFAYHKDKPNVVFRIILNEYMLKNLCIFGALELWSFVNIEYLNDAPGPRHFAEIAGDLWLVVFFYVPSGDREYFQQPRRHNRGRLVDSPYLLILLACRVPLAVQWINLLSPLSKYGAANPHAFRIVHPVAQYLTDLRDCVRFRNCHTLVRTCTYGISICCILSINRCCAI